MRPLLEYDSRIPETELTQEGRGLRALPHFGRGLRQDPRQIDLPQRLREAVRFGLAGGGL